MICPQDAVICVKDAARADEAEALSKRTGIRMSAEPGEGLTVLFGEDAVSLTGFGMSYSGDIAGMARRVSGGRLAHEMLVRAAKTKNEHPRAIDATAGMGEDSLLLAACGYEVTMFERNPVIAVLLKDALRRAAEVEELKEVVCRMHLTEGDASELIPLEKEGADLIYLDPMFPARKKSGLIGKKLQLMQKLEQPCDSETELLRAAFSAEPLKIIIKRPLKGEFLAGLTPDYSVKGKAIRYDCFAAKGRAAVL